MYKHIYVPVDNSDFSNRAIDLFTPLTQLTVFFALFSFYHFS